MKRTLALAPHPQKKKKKNTRAHLLLKLHSCSWRSKDEDKGLVCFSYQHFKEMKIRQIEKEKSLLSNGIYQNP